MFDKSSSQAGQLKKLRDSYEIGRNKMGSMFDYYNLIEKCLLEVPLNDKEKNGYVYVEIRKGMYGIPQAGILAQRLLEKRLGKAGYHQSEFTPGFWTHEWRPICFTLVVDDFGVRYVGEEPREAFA